jgi:hypothetical protein
MSRRAAATAYFVNPALGYLALVGRHVRLPEGRGRWIEAADAVRAPWEVAAILAARYAGLDARKMPFIALLADDDVEEFEREMAQTAAPASPQAAIMRSA